MRRHGRARLPPLCKGRWVGLGRAGGVVCSNLFAAGKHLTYSLLPIHYSFAGAACLAFPFEGKVSAEPTDEV